MASYDEEYETLRQQRRAAVEKKRLADYRAEVEAVEIAAKRGPEPLIVTPWGEYTAAQLLGLGEKGPDGRLVIRLEPPPAALPVPKAIEPPAEATPEVAAFLSPDPPTPLPAPPSPPEPDPWSPGARPGRAWLGHYADAHDTSEEALLPGAVPGHALVVGATRMGKTRLLLLLSGEAVADGASVVSLDLKNPEFTLARLCAVADAAGLAPGERSLFLPSVSPGPGWNPLLEGPEAVDEILETFKALAGSSWGPKMNLLFRSALVLLADRKLSLFEVPKIISDPAYARTITKGVSRNSGLVRASEYLLGRVCGPEKDPDPVLNKILGVIERPFFENCLCAERNTFSMDSLWQRQQLACFHLDRKRMGEDGAGALGVLAARRLFTAAIEPAGPGRVVLLADEAGDVDRLSGGQMERTLSQGGESRLSLILACQYLGQLPGSLRESALTNANVKCFFRLGPEDARAVDRHLGDGWGDVAAGLGKQHCLVQVGRKTPRVVRVADLDPRPAEGWNQQGQRLSPGEWDGMPERRFEAMRASVGRALPGLDAAERDWDRDGLS